MIRQIFGVAAFASFVTLGSLPPGFGNDQASERAERGELTAEEEKRLAEYNAALADFRDPAFERLIELEQLRAAVDSAQPELLTDAALLLAQGEKILMRKHRSGVRAQALLELAGRAASEWQDAAAASRIASAWKRFGNQEAAERMDALAKLANPSRAVSDDLLPHQTIIWEIKQAKLLGNQQRLKAISENLPDELSEQEQKRVRDLVREATQAVSDHGEIDSALVKLDRATRGAVIAAPVYVYCNHPWLKFGENAEIKVKSKDPYRAQIQTSSFNVPVAPIGIHKLSLKDSQGYLYRIFKAYYQHQGSPKQVLVTVTIYPSWPLAPFKRYLYLHLQ